MRFSEMNEQSITTKSTGLNETGADETGVDETGVDATVSAAPAFASPSPREERTGRGLGRGVPLLDSRAA